MSSGVVLVCLPGSLGCIIAKPPSHGANGSFHLQPVDTRLFEMSHLLLLTILLTILHRKVSDLLNESVGC